MRIDEFIGVDNGFGMTKTAKFVFTTSVKNYGTIKPPLMDDVVCYQGNYYGIGGERKKYKEEDKTSDDQTYILTLAAIAQELKHRGKTQAVISLDVGLPLESCGRDAESFANYFKREDVIEYQYSGETYKVSIGEVNVYPQGYSAVVLELKDIASDTVLIDIGSWTVDILPIVGGKPVVTKCLSLKEGVITCMNNVNEALRREIGREVTEAQIQEIMMGKKNVLPEKYTVVVESTIIEYAKNLVAILEEHKFNVETLSFVVCGGGSCIIKNFGMELFQKVRTIPDIHANAIGYEKIALASYKKRQQEG